MRSTVCVCVCERPTALTVSSSFITIVCVATRKDGVCTSQDLCFSTLCVLFFSLSLFFFYYFPLVHSHIVCMFAQSPQLTTDTSFDSPR